MLSKHTFIWKVTMTLCLRQCFFAHQFWTSVFDWLTCGNSWGRMKAKHCVKLSFFGESRDRLLKTSSNQRDRTENTKLFKETKVTSRVKHLHPTESHPERWYKENKSAADFITFVSFEFVYACVAVSVGERESQTKIVLLFNFLGQYPSTSDFGDTLPLVILVKDTLGNLPRELEPKPCTCTQQTPKYHFHHSDTCPQIYSPVAMWCSRMALCQLQRIAVTPLNIAGGLTSSMRREMATLPRVYVTRQIPPEGLKILRESGQWVTVS